MRHQSHCLLFSLFSFLDIVRAWSDFTGSSTPPISGINNNMVLAAAATTRLQQHRDVWPQLQVSYQ